MPIIQFQSDSPNVDTSVFVAPDAWIIGRVTISSNSSIFFNAVVRGDIQSISIGQYTNVQEHVTIHSSHGMSSVEIGDHVTIGHRAIIHGCTIQSHCLIGMGATILDDVTIGAGSIIGANTLITKGTNIPPGSLVIGSPGKVTRAVSEAEASDIASSAANYAKLASYYRTQFPK